MALSEKERKQVMVLLMIGAVAGTYFGFWQLWALPAQERANQWEQEIDSLSAQVDSARQDLARGTVQQLRNRVERYDATLAVMRQLVPAQNEVPNLIDDISTRAQLRGVEITDISPLSPQIVVPFQVYRYRLRVVGSFDQIGEFLTDVASLPRIMVPYELSLRTVGSDAARQAGANPNQTNLVASLMLRTFVKGDFSEEVSGGGGGTP